MRKRSRERKIERERWMEREKEREQCNSTFMKEIPSECKHCIKCNALSFLNPLWLLRHIFSTKREKKGGGGNNNNYTFPQRIYPVQICWVDSCPPNVSQVWRSYLREFVRLFPLSNFRGFLSSCPILLKWSRLNIKRYSQMQIVDYLEYH